MLFLCVSVVMTQIHVSYLLSVIDKLLINLVVMPHSASKFYNFAGWFMFLCRSFLTVAGCVFGLAQIGFLLLY